MTKGDDNNDKITLTNSYNYINHKKEYLNEICEIKSKNNICYFSKSIDNNYFYCLTKIWIWKYIKLLIKKMNLY